MEIQKTSVIEALTDAGLSEDFLYDGYSGRGMYGEICFGIICRTGELIKFFASFIEIAPWRVDLVNDLADALKNDALGRDIIFYFPGFTLTD